MADVWAMLERVGLARPGSDPTSMGPFDSLRDPIATDELAGALADRLHLEGPEIVVVWEGLSSAVLGYAVGRKLGVPVLVLSDEDGLVTASTPDRAGSRAIFVAPVTPHAEVIRMVDGYLRSVSAELVATAVLLDAGGTTSSMLSLAQLPIRETDGQPLLRPKGANDGRA